MSDGDGALGATRAQAGSNPDVMNRNKTKTSREKKAVNGSKVMRYKKASTPMMARASLISAHIPPLT
jgi:hypothetical protein